jgi:hypothetical protein
VNIFFMVFSLEASIVFGCPAGLYLRAEMG